MRAERFDLSPAMRLTRLMAAVLRASQSQTQLLMLSLPRFKLCRISRSSLAALIVSCWGKGESKHVVFA